MNFKTTIKTKIAKSDYVCFRFDDDIIDGVSPPDHLQVSSNDSDQGLTNDDDDDITCDHLSSKNLTFSSYFYKALISHDGGKILKDMI